MTRRRTGSRGEPHPPHLPRNIPVRKEGGRVPRALGTVCLLCWISPASQAIGFELSLPADCILGETCHFQNHVDRDPGPGAADHMCGTLAYDGDRGADLALPTLAAMAAGVDVLAPADGIVRALRDGMPDISIRDPAGPDIAGRECGNGLVIDHGQGWETQLCHLKQGSLRVAEGEAVSRGQPVGRIGLSGNTEFPHVEISVRRDGLPVDPFAPDPDLACGTPQPGLWAGSVAYDPFGFLDTGWATAVPAYDAIRAGLPDAAIAPDSPALVVWAFHFGARAGDVMTFTVTGPEGPFLDEAVMLDRTQAQAFRAVGKRNRTGLATGTWTAVITLSREGTVIETTATTLAVK